MVGKRALFCFQCYNYVKFYSLVQVVLSLYIVKMRVLSVVCSRRNKKKSSVQVLNSQEAFESNLTQFITCCIKQNVSITDRTIFSRCQILQ